MSNLNEYLAQKREAVRLRKNTPLDQVTPISLKARATAEGRSGIRRIRIRDHQVISDSPSDFAGYDLGPASPELLIGSLSSCLTHIYLIHAADLEIPLGSLSVEIEATQDPRAGKEGFENVPLYPHDIHYSVYITSPANTEQLHELYETVERWCPVLNLFKHASQVTGKLVHTPS